MRERRDELILFFVCIFFFSLFFLLPAYPWSEPLTDTCDTFASSVTHNSFIELFGHGNCLKLGYHVFL
jgi:hypothetical protein